MAKKKQPVREKTAAEPVLPQNIISMGEQQPDDKHIYISQTAYKAIHAFTKNKTKNEAGGMLVGKVIEAFGKSNILINGFVEAKETQSTPTTLTFTHETWNACHKTIDKLYPGQKIVGWIHTHPNYGIFLSNHDKFIQESTFSDENQVAMVVDPIQNEEGFFCWRNGALDRCPGFYIFEKNGQRITVSSDTPEKSSAGGSGDLSWIWKLLAGILAAAVLVLSFGMISLNKRVDAMQKTLEEHTVLLENYGVVYEALAPYISIIPAQDEPPTQTEDPAKLPQDAFESSAYLDPSSASEIETEEGVQTP